jgi:hypothetical protein
MREGWRFWRFQGVLVHFIVFKVNSCGVKVSSKRTPGPGEYQTSAPIGRALETHIKFPFT